MAVELTEQRLGRLRWLVVRGPAREATGLDRWRDRHALAGSMAPLARWDPGLAAKLELDDRGAGRA